MTSVEAALHRNQGSVELLLQKVAPKSGSEVPVAPVQTIPGENGTMLQLSEVETPYDPNISTRHASAYVLANLMDPGVTYAAFIAQQEGDEQVLVGKAFNHEGVVAASACVMTLEALQKVSPNARGFMLVPAGEEKSPVL